MFVERCAPKTEKTKEMSAVNCGHWIYWSLSRARLFSICISPELPQFETTCSLHLYTGVGRDKVEKRFLICISQFKLRPSHPPGQLRGICAHFQSRESGISLPKGYPRAFDTHVVSDPKYKHDKKSSSLSPIDLYVKDWTKLWRFSKVCFLDFAHFLIAY